MTEISNRLIDRGHSVSWFIPNWVYDAGQTGGWMKKKFDVYPLRASDAIAGRYDVVIFNEETQWKIAKAFPADLKIYYALHWAVLHKDYNTLRDCYNGGFRIIANSRWTADAMFLETASRPPVVNGAVNPQVFHKTNVRKNTDILTYGASRSWKGKAIATEVYDILKDRGISMRMFGDDSGIPQEKMAEAYGSARVYLSASWYEGWNWPGIESMACGTPLVISEDGGSADYAINGYNCLTYPARDSKKAADCIMRILEDERLAEKLSEHGLATAGLFDWDKEIVKFEDILKGWMT